MTRFDAVRERLAPLKERLDRSYSLGFVEQAHAWIESLSPGDRVIAYALAGLLAIISLSGVYGLQQSLLVAEPAYGGSLVEGEVGSPRFINPLLALSDSDRDLSALTYAGLMGLSGDGGLTPVLAQSYEISPDGKTYTFTLRPDAKFSDGSAVTAGDVVFTVEKKSIRTRSASRSPSPMLRLSALLRSASFLRNSGALFPIKNLPSRPIKRPPSEPDRLKSPMSRGMTPA
jgi:hypothetical protein